MSDFLDFIFKEQPHLGAISIVVVIVVGCVCCCAFCGRLKRCCCGSGKKVKAQAPSAKYKVSVTAHTVVAVIMEHQCLGSVLCVL